MAEVLSTRVEAIIRDFLAGNRTGTIQLDILNGRIHKVKTIESHDVRNGATDPRGR